MARNKETNSVPEPRTTNRQMAARMKSAAGEPDPRRDKRISYPAVPPGGPTGLKSDGGEGVAHIPLVFVLCSGRGEPLSPPKNGRSRRCFDETERLQVAATRKRGACNSCKASKIKCNHPSNVSTYQMQSHELFALGLTTPSLDANRDEHKHVMEEKIAEIDNTLVKAQENITEQNGGASGDEEMKSAASAVTQSPPEPSIPKGLSSQKPKQPPKVCHQQPQPPPTSSFKQGLNTFKVTDGQNDGQKRRRGNAALLKKDRITVTTNGAVGSKRLIARKNADGLLPIVCQQGPIDSVMTTTPAICTSITTKIHETVANCPTSNHSGEQHGCMAIHESITSPYVKTPAVATAKPRLKRVMTRRLSRSSDQESHATTPVESMLSFGRSQSPSSDRLPSEPRAYVCMSEVEHNSSEPISFEKLLYDNNFPILNDVLCYTLDGSQSLNKRPLAKVVEIPEDDAASSNGMDLDDDL